MGILKAAHHRAVAVLLLCLVFWIVGSEALLHKDDKHNKWNATKPFLENIHRVTRHRRQTRPIPPGLYGDPCTTYIRLSQPERRVGNRIDYARDSVLCDRSLRRRWYRFDSAAGGTLPETCVQEMDCGTHSPIWLNGHHPVLYGEVLDIPVCASLTGDCCARSWYIRVANCGDYFTYLLTNTPGCFMAYCAGQQTPCPDDQSSSTGYTPGCSENFPPMRGRVNLYTGEEGHMVTMYCDFEGAIQTDSVIETQWFVQGDNSGSGDEGEFPVFVETMRGRRRSTLQEGHWRGKMGSTIYCRMRSLWRDGTGVPSPFAESEKFFAGIKISQRVVSLSEAEGEAVISFQSTVPVTCLPQFRDVCKVTIELAHDPEIGGKQCLGGEIEQVVFGECSVELTPSNWRDVHNVTVIAVRDFYNDGTKSMRVNFRPTFSTVTSGLWKNYELPEVEVLVEDEKSAMCSSTGDPHYKTFDKLYYHVYLEGEFVLYKHTRLPIQINTRLTNCGETVSCNCGVAVKAGDDVIVIDRCFRRTLNQAYGSTFPEGWRSLHRHALQQGDDFVDGLKIYEYENGKRYTVHLPTGAFLDLRLGENWINLYLHASSEDKRATLGLCGTFDGDVANEFLFPDQLTMTTARHNAACGDSDDVCRFAEAWRVEPEDSFFGAIVEVPVEEHDFFAKKKYCKCERREGKSVVLCNYHSEVYNCLAREQMMKGVDKTNDVLVKSMPLRTKRDLVNTNTWTDDDVAEYFQTEFVFNRTFKGQVPNWPTHSGITEMVARTYCRDVITRSHAARVCNSINDDKIDVITDECVTDIKVTDDLTWAVSSLSLYTEECTAAIHERAEYWQVAPTTAAPGDSGPGNSLPLGAALLSEVCPADCSQHGSCDGGECQCDSGYEGDDCSTNLFKPPEIHHVSQRGLCDISSRPCEKIKIHGDAFRNITDLQCHFKNNEDILTSFEAMFVTFEEVFCPLPKTRPHSQPKHVAMTTYEMFITGNGYRSNSVNITVYDSRCYQCDLMTTVCRRQESSGCVIDDVCYGQEDNSPHDCCHFCDVTQSPYQFSIKQATGRILLFPRQTNYVTFVGHEWMMNLRAFGGSGCHFRYTADTDNPDVLSLNEGVGDLRVELSTAREGEFSFTLTVDDPCGLNITRTYRLTVKPNPSTPPSNDVICEGNIAPEFPNKSATFYIVPHEVLAVQLNADHQYQDELEYYVIKNSDNHVSISADGLLRYITRHLRSETVTVYAVDTCGQRGYMTVNIVVKECTCTNGGTCVPRAGLAVGSGVYDCACADGFSGDMCAVIDDYV